MVDDRTVPTLICEDCSSLAPESLMAVATALHHPDEPAQRFLRLAHCCACQGWATIEELTAMIDAFGDAPTPPRPLDWWHAAIVYEDMHRDMCRP